MRLARSIESREFKHLAMVSKQVLRVPRSDSQGDYILLNVNQNGLNPLDLSLEATDGLSPYTSNSLLRHLPLKVNADC